MQVVLIAINAKYIHSNLAVYSLQAYAKKQVASTISLAEYTINQNIEDILKQIYEKKPDLLAFSCYIWNITMVEQLIVELHKLLPNVPMWVGGPEVSYRAEEFLKEYPQVTGVMLGEGELVFTRLVQSYEEAAALQEVPGICYREEGRIHTTMPQRLLNMDELPFVYEDMSVFENRIIYYETSRGCPFSCSYCLSSVEKQLRFRSLELVEKELLFFLEKRVPQVKFIDRTFNCDSKRALHLWQFIQEHDNGVTNFHFEVAADLMTPQQIAVIGQMRPGLIQLEIGVQSANLCTISEIHRKMDLEKVAAVVAAIHQKENVHQHLDLIAGLPYENLDSFKHSFNVVYAMKPQQLQLGFLKVLPGSEMKERQEEYGIVCQSRPPYEVLYTKWLSYDDVCALKKVEAVVELYYNSNQFRHTMTCLVREFESPYACYESLGNVYEDTRQNGEKHNRLTQYRILLEFIRSHVPGREAVYKELLTLDVYLREKSKTRPEFAPGLGTYKDTIYAFYKWEEKKRRYLPDYEGYQYKQLVHMTHLEPFSYNLDAFIQSGRLEKKPMWLLFDYKKRSPLNQEARIVPLEMCGEWE